MKLISGLKANARQSNLPRLFWVWNDKPPRKRQQNYSDWANSCIIIAEIAIGETNNARKCLGNSRGELLPELTAECVNHSVYLSPISSLLKREERRICTRLFYQKTRKCCSAVKHCFHFDERNAFRHSWTASYNTSSRESFQLFQQQTKPSLPRRVCWNSTSQAQFEFTFHHHPLLFSSSCAPHSHRASSRCFYNFSDWSSSNSWPIRAMTTAESHRLLNAMHAEFQ